MSKILNTLRLAVWTTEFAWKALSYFIVLAGGSTAGLLAWGTKIFYKWGPIVWFGFGLASALVVALILFLLRKSQYAAAMAAATTAVIARASNINPLHTSFSDSIIRVHDLYLPGVQLHENKHFNRCHFYGPGAIVVQGGTFIGCGFNIMGDIIPLPDKTNVVGIVVLKNCTLEKCHFHQVTILCPAGAVEPFRKIPGVWIAGE
ncbi:hypothetical protein [Burkholderia gladioli]|uniref:hypothetical protein n=1 Tax=Burkholderia gladioli TaxID=28095 RepID=UPI001640897A|nr:hypothetical protein [Burkholderia gladioli]